MHVVYDVPFAFATGTNFNNPLVIFAAETTCPTVTFTPFNCNVPTAGRVVTFTLLNVFAGLSFVSLNQKFAVVNVYVTSSSVVTAVSVPAGASFTEVTFTVIVFGL